MNLETYIKSGLKLADLTPSQLWELREDGKLTAGLYTEVELEVRRRMRGD